MTPLASLIFKIMVSFVPLSYPSAYPNHEEPQVVVARYESIATDIAEGAEKSVKDPDTTVFDDDPKGVKIAILLAIIAATESNGYSASVDTCTRGGDNNTSWTIFQLTMAYAPKHEVCHNRKKAVEYAIKFIKQSFTYCHHLPLHDRMSGYDTGKCKLGEPISNQRLGSGVFHGMAGMAVSGLDKTINDFRANIAAL